MCFTSYCRHLFILIASISSRKFNIPGLDRSLKWRRTGSQGGWECTSPTTSTPVATFEPANLTSPAKIKIYCTDIVPPQRNLRVAKVNGVCTLLMDYIVLTTLLLLTNKDDWKMLAVSRSASVSVGSNSPSSSSPVSPISPITPFSANQSPSMPTYDARSWYSPAMGNGTLISHCSSNGSSYYGSSSATGTFISVRSTSSNRHRPRTSPSSSTLSSLAGSTSSVPASTQQRAVRRAASQFVRPGSQWSSYSASKSTTVPTASNSQSSFEYEEEEEEEEESPVLDIRPTQDRLRTTSQMNPHSRSYSYDPSPARTPSPAQTPTRDRALRVQVPTTPMLANSTTMSAAPTSTVSAYPQQHLPFLKTDPAELPPPPPYEEIEWTVRLKTPRRARSTIFGQ